MVCEVLKEVRVEFGMSEIILVFECGGFDLISGIVLNFLIGVVLNFFVDEGGSSILSEIIEVIGVEYLLVICFEDEEMKDKFFKFVSDVEKRVIVMGEDLCSG